MDGILAAIVAIRPVLRILLGCAWMCGTFALKQTWVGISSTGSRKGCNLKLTNSSPTCMLSGTIGIVPARGNGSASAIRAVMSHDDTSSSLICTLIHLFGGTVHFRRFKWLGPFRSNRIAGPTCPDKEVWILAMLYVMFYVVSIL